MQVGYLGVGNMGQPMAAKLLDGGHNLVVFDLSETAMEPLLLRQARRAAAPKEIGDQCEIAVVSLPTLAAFREAVLGPEGLAAGGAIKLLLNTCSAFRFTPTNPEVGSRTSLPRMGRRIMRKKRMPSERARLVYTCSPSTNRDPMTISHPDSRSAA